MAKKADSEGSGPIIAAATALPSWASLSIAIAESKEKKESREKEVQQAMMSLGLAAPEDDGEEHLTSGSRLESFKATARLGGTAVQVVEDDDDEKVGGSSSKKGCRGAAPAKTNTSKVSSKKLKLKKLHPSPGGKGKASKASGRDPGCDFNDGLDDDENFGDKVSNAPAASERQGQGPGGIAGRRYERMDIDVLGALMGRAQGKKTGPVWSSVVRTLSR